jgi:hypothetical protein
MKFGMYIMTSEPVSTAYFMNLSHESVFLYAYPPVIARQRHGKHVPVAKKNCWKPHFLCCECRTKGKQAIHSSKNFMFIPLFLSLFTPFICLCTDE